MELDGKKGLGFAINSFIAPIVGILEELFPSRRKGGGIDLETMVLTCDVTPPAEDVGARDIMATISVLHL